MPKKKGGKVFLGVMFGLAATMIWGAVYLVPLWLPEYSAAMIAAARYAFFGVVVLPTLWWQKEHFARYSLKDWIVVTELGLLGNIVYYWFLSECIQSAGAPLAGMCMAVIPVLVAFIGNWRDRHSQNAVPLTALIPGLAFIAAGLVIGNWGEFRYVVEASQKSSGDFWYGLAMGVLALLVWTWYPIRNAEWLQRHPGSSASAWSAAQGFTSLPFAIVMYAWVWHTLPSEVGLFGERPWAFIGIMLGTAVVCSWVGIICWNEMSRRLPTALGGQMIVFESIFAVIYAHLLRSEWPKVSMVVGMSCLVIGVLMSLRAFSRKKAS